MRRNDGRKGGVRCRRGLGREKMGKWSERMPALSDLSAKGTGGKITGGDNHSLASTNPPIPSQMRVECGPLAAVCLSTENCVLADANLLVYTERWAEQTLTSSILA